MRRSARLRCFACRRPVPPVSPAVTVNGHAGRPGGSPRGPCAGSGGTLERCMPCGPGLHPAWCGARRLGRGTRTQTVTSAKAGPSSGPQRRRHERLQCLRHAVPWPGVPVPHPYHPGRRPWSWHPCNRDQRLGRAACPRGPGSYDQAEKPGRLAAIPCPEQKAPERSLRNQVCGQGSGVPLVPSRRPSQYIGHGLQSADRCPGRALTVKVDRTLPHPERGAAPCHSRSQTFRLATGATTACARCACVSTGSFGHRSVSRSRQNFITPRRTLLSCCWNCARRGAVWSRGQSRVTCSSTAPRNQAAWGT